MYVSAFQIWYNFVIDKRNEEEEMEKKQYTCEKCGHMHYVSDQFQATGGNFAKIFDVQNKKFITISCAKCGYTELYRGETSTGWDILDFLTNG